MCKTVNRNFLKKNRKNPIFWWKSMSYNVVFLNIKDFWWNFIFETLDNKKNNQKMDQKIKRRLYVSQFLSENSNSLIVGTSIKFWSQIYNILGYMEKSIFWKFGVYFRWKMCKTVNRNFLKKNRKNPIFWGKSMSYNVVFLCIKDFWWFLKLWTINQKMDQKIKRRS